MWTIKHPSDVRIKIYLEPSAEPGVFHAYNFEARRARKSTRINPKANIM